MRDKLVLYLLLIHFHLGAILLQRFIQHADCAIICRFITLQILFQRQASGFRLFLCFGNANQERGIIFGSKYAVLNTNVRPLDSVRDILANAGAGKRVIPKSSIQRVLTRIIVNLFGFVVVLLLIILSAAKQLFIRTDKALRFLG